MVTLELDEGYAKSSHTALAVNLHNFVNGFACACGLLFFFSLIEPYFSDDLYITSFPASLNFYTLLSQFNL